MTGIPFPSSCIHKYSMHASSLHDEVPCETDAGQEATQASRASHSYHISYLRISGSEHVFVQQLKSAFILFRRGAFISIIPLLILKFFPFDGSVNVLGRISFHPIHHRTVCHLPSLESYNRIVL